jgi:serpin B
MGKINRWFAAALAAFAGFTFSACATPLTDGNNAFALDLYAQLKATDGNLFFSPYSISTCLAMVYTGARGDTAEQMAATLHYLASPTELLGLFKTLGEKSNTGDSVDNLQLTVVNALWSQKDYPFTQDFLTLVKDNFAANLNQVDFRTQAEPARQQINTWVSQRTHDKINDLIPSDAITPHTQLILVNAIYFKGNWLNSFSPERTRPAPFFVTSTNQSNASLMHQESLFQYFETDEAQLLKLRYVSFQAPDPDFSMVVILPKQRDGLNRLESTFTPAALDQWLASMHSEEVIVFLPKFKLSNRFALADTLTKMGMPLASSTNADFSGMDNSRDLSISAVIHQAFVDVNEQGTEAFAAVAVGMSDGFSTHPPIVFRADHPFIFLIRDADGSILFFGRVTDPSK